jgi:hypothetical protein
MTSDSLLLLLHALTRGDEAARGLALRSAIEDLALLVAHAAPAPESQAPREAVLSAASS